MAENQAIDKDNHDQHDGDDEEEEEDIVMITASDGEEYEVPSSLLAICDAPQAALDSEQWGLTLSWYDRWQYVITSSTPIDTTSHAPNTDGIPIYSPHMARIVVGDNGTLPTTVPPLLPWYDCGVDANRIDRLYIIAQLLQCRPLLDHCQRVHAIIRDLNTRRWSMTDIAATMPPTTTDAASEHHHKNRLLFVVDSRVYDATHFMDKHPGGKVLLQGVGRDATSLFAQYHRTSRAIELLNIYCVGILDDSKASHTESKSTSTLATKQSTATTAAPAHSSLTLPTVEPFIERVRRLTSRIYSYVLAAPPTK